MANAHESVSPANPFNHEVAMPEPPRGTVLAYQRATASGDVLDYVSFRAGNGKWYTTGDTTQRQGVSWRELSHVLRVNGSRVHYATSWTEMPVPTFTEAQRAVTGIVDPDAGVSFR